MNIFKKILVFLSMAILLSGCNTLRKGFEPDKRSGEEFLVEKKSPLVIPPNYNELPIPNQKKPDEVNRKTNVKELLLGSKKKVDVEEKSSESVSTIEQLILKEIKKN